MERVTLQLKWKHQFQFAGYYAAIEQGYYAERGLEVDLLEGKPGILEVDELISGNADYAVSMSDALIARHKGVPIVVLANIFQHSPSIFLTLKKSGIDTPQDFFDKTVMMIPGIKSAEIQAMLLREGISLDRIDIVSPSWKIDDLIYGKVDAISAYASSQPYELEKRGVEYTIITPRSYGIDFYGDNLITTEEEVRTHPRRVAAFREASLQGWKYALEHPEEIIDLILAEYTVDRPGVTRDLLRNELEVSRKLIIPDFVDIGHVNPGRWKHIAEIYGDLGMIDQTFSLNGFLYEPDVGGFDWNHPVVKWGGASIALAVAGIGVLLFFMTVLNREVRARKRSEERFNLAMEASQDGVFDWNLVTNEIYYSPGWKRILGYEDHELPNDFSVWEDFTHPEDVERSWNMQQQLVNRERERFEIEFRMKHREGRWVQILSRARCDFDSEGKAVRIVGTHVDVSKLKEMETELVREKEKFESYMRNLPGFAFIKDGEGRYVYLNDGLLERFGVTREQWEGRTDRELGYFSDELVATLEEQDRLVLQTNRPFQVVEEIPLADATLNWFKIKFPIVNVGSGQDKLLAGVAVDIDERIQAERKLKESEERFKLLFEQAPLSYQSLDENGNFLETNQTWLEVLGYDRSEVIGRNFSEFILPEWRHHFRDNFPRFKAVGEVLGVEFEMVKKDGSPILVNFFGKIGTNDDGSFKQTHCVFRDITEQKSMEEQLEAARRMDSIGTLAGGIAHDFNNILASIIGFTELALDDVKKGSPIEDNLQEVYTAGKRARDLVGQILTFSRQTVGETRPIRVRSVVEEVLQLMRPSIPADIEIRSELDSGSLMMGDKTRLHQMVMNLCTNAAQAMENDGGELFVTLHDTVVDGTSGAEVAGLAAGEYITLSVSDTGTGISPENLDSIFDPYFTTKGSAEGTGMGLAMVHGIVENCGGKIVVDTEITHGTTFTVYLPATRRREVEDVSAKTAENPGGTERILIVDDEVAITKMVGKTLERLGYTVTAVNSSVDALELFRTRPDGFDLIVTDMTMPKMTGDKLAAEVMAVRGDIPVILNTGYSKKISDDSAAEIGIKAFVHKPIIKADLALTVRRVLDEARIV